MKRERHYKHLNTLTTIAEDLAPSFGAKVAAAIVLKNEVISVGVNRTKTHPFQAQFSKHDEAIWMHAETSAIYNALKKITADDLKKSTLYVARVKKEKTAPGQYVFVHGLACPCKGCKSAIKHYDIKQVIYTTGDEKEFATL